VLSPAARVKIPLRQPGFEKADEEDPPPFKTHGKGTSLEMFGSGETFHLQIKSSLVQEGECRRCLLGLDISHNLNGLPEHTAER
jgi:hypothetical protein